MYLMHLFQANHLKAYLIILVVSLLIFESYAEDEFKSLIELKEKYGQDYGPTKKTMFPFAGTIDELNIVEVNIYRTKSAIDENYALSSKSIVGRKIISKLGAIPMDKANRLLKELTLLDNYGDMLVGVFLPSIAIEFVAGEDTFIVNYSTQDKTLNFTSATLKGLRPAFWGEPLFVSDEMALLIESLVKEE